MAEKGESHDEQPAKKDMEEETNLQDEQPAKKDMAEKTNLQNEQPAKKDMAEKTSLQGEQTVKSDCESDDDSTPAESDDDQTGTCKPQYITKSSQICYDRILPRDLNTIKTSITSSKSGASNACGQRIKLWHKETLNVFFEENNGREDEILKLASTWSKHCGIEFKKVTDRRNSDIRVGFSNELGSWSYIGTECVHIPVNELTMNLGDIDRVTVLHEFGHALGLVHEHQSPADRGFEWNRDNVIADYSNKPNCWDKEKIEANILYRYKNYQISGTSFDPQSIMNYA